MSGKGKARVDARRVKKMSRKAKESQEERPKKVQKVGAKTRAVPLVEVDDIERVQILDPRANDPFDETDDDDEVMVDDTRGNMNEYVCAVGDGMIPLSVDGVSGHVPLKIKTKIWANQFINLPSLLDRNGRKDSSILYLNEDGRIESRSSGSKDEIRSKDHWTDCFLIFVDIYIQNISNKALELVKYMTIIRDAADRYPGWRQYDRQFRFRQSLSLSSWAVTNSELWQRVMPGDKKDIVGSNSGSSQSVGSKSSQSMKCRHFNNGDCHYIHCRFAHACELCGSQDHGKFKCMNQRNDFSPFNGNYTARS